jgi:hypothetical protein
MSLKVPQTFYYPDDIGDPGAFSQDMAILNDETPADAQDKDKDEKQQEDEDVARDLKVLGETEAIQEPPPEDSEEPEEDEEEGEQEEEEPPVSGKPALKDIKKDFPDLFKRYPALKGAFFRDAEFSKVFPTPKDAEEAAQKAENYDTLESSLVQGSPELLMKELSENNPRAFGELAKNWLPQLRALDNKLYVSVTEPVVEELIYVAFQHANKIGDKNLAMSARHLANFVFANGGEIPDLTERATRKPNPAEIQLQKEREEWAQTRYKEADSEIFTRVTRALDQNIRQGLDPSNTITDRMKTSIVNDIINEVNKMLMGDQAHGKRMSALWKKAVRDSFSRQSKESIVSTYLSGAKPLIRELRNRIRAEYLGTNGSTGKRKLEEKPGVPPQKKRPFEGSSRRVDPRRERGVVLDPRKIDYSRTSDMDILMDQPTLKGQNRTR